jgi:hypothetical protein
MTLRRHHEDDAAGVGPAALRRPVDVPALVDGKITVGLSAVMVPSADLFDLPKIARNDDAILSMIVKLA